MLAHYGVLKGNFVSSGEHQGQWLHAILNLNVNETMYECAVDVNEPSLGFQYKIFDNMDASLFSIISSLPDGYHELQKTSTSGAMDYERSPILQNKLGCLAVFVALWNSLFKTNDTFGGTARTIFYRIYCSRHFYLHNLFYSKQKA